MPMRPLVGVSANRFPADPERPVFKNMELHYGEFHLLEAIYRAGGLPLLIPDLKSAQAIEDCVEKLDSLLLAGGADVCPESYQRTNYDPKWPGDKVRDEYEIALIKAAERSRIPILGVCRGMQILNVAFGGTLFQDISTEKSGSLVHRDWEIYEQNVHEVSLEPNSWLSKLYARSTIKVNTIHHQGVRDLAPTFRATAHAPDGVIEAVENNSGKWIRGVQWHPEWQKLDQQGVDDMEVIFREFIEDTKRNKS